MRLVTGLIAFFLCSAVGTAGTIGTPAIRPVQVPQFDSPLILPMPRAPVVDPAVSWGKVGISFAQYNEDKSYCASYGLNYARNARSLAHNIGVSAQRLNTAQMQWGQEAIDHCLALRGYNRFRLTEPQLAHLQSLEHGSGARAWYLYALASDAAVIGLQRI